MFVAISGMRKVSKFAAGGNILSNLTYASNIFEHVGTFREFEVPAAKPAREGECRREDLCNARR